MEPRIQYAKTEDGVNIAYWTLGEGDAIVHLPWMGVSHLQLEWQHPDFRRWYERLAENRMLVRYDTAGTGLSDRDVIDFSLETRLPDMEAVVDRLGVEKFALVGFIHSGLAAILYAVRHPERVTHLILWCSYARGSDYASSPQIQVLRAAAEKDWDTYLKLGPQLLFGWSGGEQASRYEAYMRGALTPELLRAMGAAVPDYDVTSLLPQVQSPTLVLHRREVPYPQMDSARTLASQIPGAQLVVLEGTSLLPFAGDTDEVIRAMDDFLGTGKREASESAPSAPSGLVTILFTDMESSTSIARLFGDRRAQEVRRDHNKIVRSALSANVGSEIKHTGDGIMASFATASSALECAIAIQRGVAAHKEQHPDSPLGVYVGLNAGEPISEDDDLFGTSVDLAARLVDHAQPGQIVASDVVRQLAAGKDFLFADLGETELRGFEDPVKLWELRWLEQD